MIRNYLTVAIRNLWRYWGYTLINILGLAIALTCAMQITAYVRHQLAFNVHLDPENRIYRVMRKRPGEGGTEYWTPDTRARVAPVFATDVPGVEKAFKSFTRRLWIRHGDQSRRPMACIADTAFIDYFSLPVVEGDAREILRRPGSAMVTESFAKELFGNVDPVGRMVSMDYKWGVKGEWIIHGILRDPVEATSKRLAFRFLTISRPSQMDRDLWVGGWGRSVFQTWVVLKEGVRPVDIASKFGTVLARVSPPEELSRSALSLQPVNRMHLYTRQDYDIGNTGYWSPDDGDIGELRLFVSGGVLILLIAAANFINLTTAHASARGLEVGVRKAIGATRSQLTTQFLLESLLVAFSAAVIAFVTSRMISGVLSTYLGVLVPEPAGWTSVRDLFLITIVQSFLSCSYPSIYLSALRPTIVLARSSPKGSGQIGRKGLVVFQFAISAVLMMTTFAISRQMTFLHEKDLGFDEELLVTMPIFNADNALRDRFVEVRDAFERHPQVIRASVSLHPIGAHNSVDWLHVSRIDRREEQVRMDFLPVDESFVDTYGLSLFDGSDFGQTYERPRCILSEKGARLLGYYADNKEGEYGESPVSGQVWAWGEPWEVVGVVRDFQHSSLHRPVSPIMLMNGGPYAGYLVIAVRIAPDHVSETLAHLERTWDRFVPGKPFEHQFLNDRFAKFYARESIVHRGLSLTAGLAIFTACLGVLGLAAFVVRQRVKEVGVRRVLGASESSIFILLSSDFVRLVVLANMIGVPIAWFALDRWLSNFAYRITLGPSIFMFGAITGLLFALAAVAWQARAAARMNPVDSLRVQ